MYAKYRSRHPPAEYCDNPENNPLIIAKSIKN